MPGGSKKGGGLEVGSAYKMKGSPHKLGTIEGTSAFKKKMGPYKPFDVDSDIDVITDEKGNPTITDPKTGKTRILKDDEWYYDENKARTFIKSKK